MKTISPDFRTGMMSRMLTGLLSLLLILSLHVAPTLAQQTRGLGLNSPQTNVKSWPGSSKRWALIIGVDKYKDGQISALKGAANDANELAKALITYAGFPSDQVIVMTTSAPEERQPSRVNILRRLTNLASIVPKDGLLLISFAGHGMERGGQAFLLPTDAQITDDVTFLEETAVSVTRMKERIRATGVSQVVLMLDACRNDPSGRADAPNPLTAAYTKGFSFDVRNREVTAFATLYATAIGQRAYEYSEKRQGYFTWAVVEGLKGGAANPNGEVTLAGLLKYVQEVVPKRIGIDLGSGKQQKPFAVVEGYRADELVIAIAGSGNANVEKASAPAASDATTLEVSFWESIKDSSDPGDYQAYLEKYPNGTFAALARRRAQGSRASTSNASSDEVVTQPSRRSSGSSGSSTEMLAQAERDLKDGNLEQAITISRDVLAAQPDNGRAHMLIGIGYFVTRKYANAVASLVKAVSLGEKINIPIKHHHKIIFNDDLCEGYLVISKDAFEFHSTTRGGHDFSVPLSKVLALTAQPDRGGRLQVKVGIQKEKKEDRKDYNFHPLGATLVKQVSNGQEGLTVVICNNCLSEMQALQQLIQQSAQLQTQAPASP